ncbi:ATP-binding cassette domain-containing protein [Alteromonas gracilis]
MSGDVLAARDLWFGYAESWVLRGVDLEIRRGETVGLWGPSGCGKSTLGGLLAGRLTPDRGQVVTPPRTGRAHPVQLISQHAERAVNPRWRIRDVLAEASTDLEPVLASGLVSEDWLRAHPHELSGGELQRVNLARALLARPTYLVADEISASLDAITQVQIWELLLAGVRRGDHGVLAISHDAALLEAVADRVVALADLQAPAQPA